MAGRWGGAAGRRRRDDGERAARLRHPVEQRDAVGVQGSTGYDNVAVRYLATIHIAGINEWLRPHG
jgi:hypothetical protein